MGKVQTRIVIGAVLIAGFLGLLFADVALDRWAGVPYAPVFWALLTVALLKGCSELFGMLRRKDRPGQSRIGSLFVLVMVALVFGETQFPLEVGPWLHEHGLEVYLLAIVGLVFTTFVAEIVRVEREGASPADALAGVAWTLLVVLTVGLLGVFLAKIRFFPVASGEGGNGLTGLVYLLLAMGTVKGADIGAWSIGTAIGRHKLVPILSPGKTWQGLGGAFVGGIGAAMAIGIGVAGFGWREMLVFGAVVSVSAVLGDLAESLMKRASDVKDSGRIPGFGGALDILDSMLAAAPVAYLLLVLLA